MAQEGRHRALGFWACALASSMWGCGFFFGKIALREMGSPHMVLYRFLFSMPIILPVLFSAGLPRFSRREWAVLSLASFLGVPVQFLLQFRGLSLTTVSHAALMVGTLPVILAVGATLFAGERLPPLGWLALTGSTAGAALIALGAHGGGAAAGHPSLAGDLLVVISLMISLCWILLNKRLMGGHNHLQVTAWGVVLGTAMLLPWVLGHDGPAPVGSVSPRAWAALAASGLLCTASTTLLWNWGMTQVPASQAGVLLNMEPLIGSLLGVFILHEHLGATAWLGGALILGAAITLTSTRQPAAAAEAERSALA